MRIGKIDRKQPEFMTEETSPFGRVMGVNPHYQKLMGEIVRQEKPAVVVETGVDHGISSEYYLAALDANGHGHLYSIDPSPSSFFDQNPIIHPRFTFIRERSQDALQPLFERVGMFDIAIHDSDHGYDCQSFEYEFFWNHTRPGGIIASDDATWGGHGAWRKFIDLHGVTGSVKTIGHAVYFKKP